MGKTFKFGIVGCGIIAHAHAGAVLSAENAELTAVCDAVEDRAREFCEKYNAGKYFTDYRKMIEDGGIDAVCICTPSGLHGEAAIHAANCKKHILCEKPIDITKEKMDAMISAVRENGVKMGCVFSIRTRPASIALRNAVREGKFGRIILADSYQKLYRSQAYYDSAGWRGTWALDGGGALMNQCIHGIDQLLWTVGDVKSVYAHAAALTRNIEVEDTAVAAVKFENGALGVLEGTTSVYPGYERRLEIHGEKGTAVMVGSDITEWKIEGSDEQVPEIQKPKYKVKEGLKGESHLPLVLDLMEAVLEDREPYIPPESARKAVDLILAIYESAKLGREVDID